MVEVQDGAITGVRQFLRKTVSEVERGDSVTVERSDLPDDVVPFVVHERDGLVPAFVVPVGQFVRAVVVEHQRARDGRRAFDVGINPQRKAIERAPVFAGELSRRHKVGPFALAANGGLARRRTQAQRVIAAPLGLRGQRHFAASCKGPRAETLHVVEEAGLMNGLVPPPHQSSVSLAGAEGRAIGLLAGESGGQCGSHNY